MMEEQHAKLEQYRATREKLVLAQKLFDIDQSSFAELYRVEDEMHRLDKLFDVYRRFVAAEQRWSSVLWAELELGSIERGIEDFLEDVEEMDEELQAVPMHQKLLTKPTGFRDSLPQIAKLNDSAVRERHWQEVMERTGIHFDMDAESFTLGKLFRLQLNRYPDLIDSIFQTAQSESNLAKEILELARF